MLKLYKSLLLTVICISSVCNISTGYCSNNNPRKTVFPFDKKQIHHGDFSSININNYEIISIGIDPAVTSGPNADKTGIIVTGIRKDINNNKYYTDILENYSGIFRIIGNPYYKYNNDLYKKIDGTEGKFYKLNQDFVVDENKIYTEENGLQITNDNLHHISDLQLKLAYIINKYKPYNIVFEKNQGHDFITDAIQGAIQLSNKHDVKLIPFFSKKYTIQMNEAQNDSEQLKSAKEKRANIVSRYLDTHNVIFNKDILFVDNSIEYTDFAQIMLNQKEVRSPDELDALHMSLFGNHNMNLYWFNSCNETEFKKKCNSHTDRFIRYTAKTLQGNEQMDTDNEWEQDNENNGSESDSDYGGDNGPNNTPDNSNDDNPNEKNRKTSDKKNMRQGFKNKNNNNTNTISQFVGNFAPSNAKKNNGLAPNITQITQYTTKSDSKKHTLSDIAENLKPVNNNDSRNNNNINNNGSKKILQNTFNKNLKIKDKSNISNSAMKHNKQNAIQNNSDKKNKYNENNTSIQKRKDQEYDEGILKEVNDLVIFNIEQEYEILENKKISEKEMQQYLNTVLELLEKDIIQYKNSSQIKEDNTNNKFVKICRNAEILTFDNIKTYDGLYLEYMRILKNKQLNDQYIKKFGKEKKYSEDEKIINKKVINDSDEENDIDSNKKSEEMNMIIDLTDDETRKTENRQNINKNEPKSSNNINNQEISVLSALRGNQNEINTSGNSNQNRKIEQNENNNPEKFVTCDSRDYKNKHQNIVNNNKYEIGKNTNPLNDQLMIVSALANSGLLDESVTNITLDTNKNKLSLEVNKSFESNAKNNNSGSQCFLGNNTNRQNDNQISKQKINEELERTKLRRHKENVQKLIMAKREELRRRDNIREEVNKTRGENDKRQ